MAKKKRLVVQGIPVYLDKHLLPSTKVLLGEAKMMKRNNLLQFVWTSNGELFVKRAEGEPGKKIRDLSDLQYFKSEMMSMGDIRSKRMVDDRSPEKANGESEPNKKFQTQAKPERSRKNSLPGIQTTLDRFSAVGLRSPSSNLKNMKNSNSSALSVERSITSEN